MASAVAPAQPVTGSPLAAGGLVQRLRIGSGLILFAFVLSHFLNHALGLFSLDAMEAMQGWRTAITRALPGTIVLAGALVVHLALNLYKIATRSTWRMPAWEAAQIILGLAIPILLAYHAAVQRAAYVIEGSDTPYSGVLPGMWNNAALQQTVLLLVVWAHGCIGLHYWLRLGRTYRTVAPVLFGLAVLIPAAALAGFMVGAREAIAAVGAAPPAEAGAAAPQALTPNDVQAYAVWSAWAMLGGLAAVVTGRTLLTFARHRIRITYADGPSILAPIGPTLLELSRMFGVPARLCLRRAGALFHVPRQGGSRSSDAAAEDARGGGDAHAHPCRRGRAACVPIQAGEKHHRDAAGAAARRATAGPCCRAGGGRRRAHARRALPRHPRFHHAE